jgi:ubiquinone/menaquinone biosynthesis C-methylase UbiE
MLEKTDKRPWSKHLSNWIEYHRNEVNKLVFENDRASHIINLLGTVKNKKILEVGSGSGIDSIALAKLGASCYCLDYVKEALQTTRELSSMFNVKVKLFNEDCGRMSFHDKTFDLVFSGGLLEHFKYPVPILCEQIRVLKDDGVLLVDVPQRFALHTIFKTIRCWQGKWFTWETEFSFKELEAIGRRLNMKIVKTYGYQLFFLPNISRRVGFDIKSIVPFFVRESLSNIEDKVENSFLGKYICSSIGVFFVKT